MASTANNVNRDNIFSKISNYLKNIDAFEISSTLFTSLENDYQRVALVYSILESASLLPVCVTKDSKSSLKSEVHRNEGNSAFKKKQDIIAIKCYSQSIASAPFGSKELSLGFANRSAVTYSLGEFSNSIMDIDAALRGEYPDNLKYKLFERKGRCLKKSGMEKSAKENFVNALNWLEKSVLNESKQKEIGENLKSEIKECNNQDKMQQNERLHKYIPVTAHSVNLEVASASDSIKIEYVESLGRHLVATRDILPGDVLVVEKPYASVVIPDAYTLYCYNCHLRSHSLIPCPSCSLVLYCSEECRSRSWSLSHKVECEVLPLYLSFGLKNIELLSLRILLTVTNEKGSLKNFIQEIPEIEKFKDLRTKGFNNKGKYDSSDYKTIHHLIGNTELRNNSDLFRRSVIAACMLHFLITRTNFFPDDSENIIVPNFKHIKIPSLLKSNKLVSDIKIFCGGLLLKYLQSLPSNAHEVTEMIMINKGDGIEYNNYEFGGAAYPVLSLTNHSCDPNVVRHSYNGNTTVLTAIQLILEGEQIFDSYGYHHAVHDRHSRQKSLLQQYYFNCRCLACIEDWPLYTQMPTENPVYHDPSLQAQVEQSSEIFKKMLSGIVEGNVDGKLSFLFKHLTLLHKAIKRPWKEYSECQEAAKQCLSLQGNFYFS